MIKWLFAVLLLLVTTGCSTVSMTVNTSKKKMLHVEYEEYVDRFRVAHKRITGFDIDVNNVIMKPVLMRKDLWGKNVLRYDSRVAGFCLPSRNLPAVYINIDVWRELPDMLREELIFHELGHCVLRRPHCDSSFTDIPVSIMRSHLVSQRFYVRFRDYYHKELFKQPACKGRF